MIDFKPALLLPAYVREPRAQFRFWGTPLLLTVDEPTRRRRSQLEVFRDWLGQDPASMDRDDVYASLIVFRRARCKRRRNTGGPQVEFRTIARKVSKPRSLGIVPSATERRGWVRSLDLPPMPKTRGECPETRPCTFVRCRYHLKLDINQDLAKRIPDGKGGVTTTAPLKDLFPLYRIGITRTGDERERYVYPGMPLEEMPGTCALDVAGERAQTLEQVGAYLSVVLERARQEVDEAVEEFAAKMGIERQEAILVLRLEGQRTQNEK